MIFRFRDVCPHARGVLPLLALATALLATPSTVAAQTPRTPEEMLDNASGNLHSRLHELMAAPLTTQQALDAVREFIDGRRLAQRVIALDFSLDDFGGIIMCDRYDDVYVEVVDSLIIHYTSDHPDLPGPEAATRFAGQLGTLPPLGETPAAFIIAILISRAYGAAASIPADDPMKEEIGRVALRAIGQATSSYRATRGGELREKSDEFWHPSVIARLICPDHRSVYTITETRHGLKPDGALFRRYVITCKKGGETRNVDFDLGALSEMTRSGGLQDLTKPILSPSDRRPGADP